MRLTIKLLPPFRLAEEKGEYFLDTEHQELTIEQLTGLITQIWAHRLAHPLKDEKKGYLIAEFLVNGQYALPEYKLSSGDKVTVVPYICGG